MTKANNIPFVENQDSLTLFIDGVPQTVTRGNSNFYKIRRALLDSKWDEVLALLTVEDTIKSFTGGKVEVKGNSVFYLGKQIHGTVVDKLLGLLREGLKDATPFVKFIENLYDNPSAQSVEELYDFLEHKGLPIDSDGYVLAYKGVQDNYWSCTGSLKTIVLKGRVNSDGRIYNGVGEVVQVARNQVDENRERGCSFGLHVGNFDYASGFGSKTMLVRFNPRDAVSVPSDCYYQKLRVCEYEVLKEISHKNTELRREYYDSTSDFNDELVTDEEVFDAVADCLTENITLGASDTAKIRELLDDKYLCGLQYSNEQLDNAIAQLEADEEDVDCTADANEYDLIRKVEAYIENKLDEGFRPSLKQIQSRLKGYSVTCEELRRIAIDLGYSITPVNGGSHDTVW